MHNKWTGAVFDFQSVQTRIFLRKAYRAFRDYEDVNTARMMVLSLLQPRTLVQADGRVS